LEFLQVFVLSVRKELLEFDARFQEVTSGSAFGNLEGIGNFLVGITFHDVEVKYRPVSRG
jgi:hypothetical protein